MLQFTVAEGHSLKPPTHFGTRTQCNGIIMAHTFMHGFYQTLFSLQLHTALIICNVLQPCKAKLKPNQVPAFLTGIGEVAERVGPDFSV